jgi:hypothetical protein
MRFVYVSPDIIIIIRRCSEVDKGGEGCRRVRRSGEGVGRSGEGWGGAEKR